MTVQGQPQPSVGRIVHVPVDPATTNGADVAPAVITRVWNERVVNVRILADARASADEWRTSLTFVDSIDDGEGLCRWTWPARV